MNSKEQKNKCYWQAEKDAFEAIARIGSYEAMTEEERNRYDDAQRHYWDSIAVYEAAVEEGMKNGMKEEKKKVALSLIQDGFPTEFVMRHTDLSDTEIEELRKQHIVSSQPISLPNSQNIS